MEQCNFILTPFYPSPAYPMALKLMLGIMYTESIASCQSLDPHQMLCVRMVISHKS